MRPRIALPSLLLVAMAVSCTTGSSSTDPQVVATTTAVATTTTSTVPATTTTTLPGTGLVLTVGRTDQPAGWFPAALTAELATLLGFEATATAAHQLPAFAAYPALAQGDIDLWATSQSPDDAAWQAAELEPGVPISTLVEQAATLTEDGVVRGFVVNRTLAEDLLITSLAAIDDEPGLAALFDREGDGAADISGCPFDSACAEAIATLIDQAGWSRVTQTRGGTGAFVNDAEQRVEAGEPILLYLESPSSAAARLVPGENVLWLAAAESTLIETVVPTAPASVCTADPCWTGFANSTLGIMANAALLAEHPALAALLGEVTVSANDLSFAALQVERGIESDSDVRALARQWITDNRPLVDEWVAVALAAT